MLYGVNVRGDEALPRHDKMSQPLRRCISPRRSMSGQPHADRGGMCWCAELCSISSVNALVSLFVVSPACMRCLAKAPVLGTAIRNTSTRKKLSFKPIPFCFPLCLFYTYYYCVVVFSVLRVLPWSAVVRRGSSGAEGFPRWECWMRVLGGGIEQGRCRGSRPMTALERKWTRSGGRTRSKNWSTTRGR